MAGCARNGSQLDSYEKEAEIPKTSFSFDRDQQPFGILSQYKMVPGDVLDVLYHINKSAGESIDFRVKIDYEVSVKFVNFPELNETQIVRPDGMISLPYLGQVRVLDLTVQEIEDNLRSKYGKFMRNPEIYVQVPEYRRDIEEFKMDLHTAPRGLSRLVTVRPDGYATFALLGDVCVAGRTIPDVSAEINERYPAVFPMLRADLFLETHAGSNIYVLGQVDRQGSYSVQDFTTVVEALALAGGPTDKGELESVVVFRRDRDARLIARKVDVKSMLAVSKKAIAFYLVPNDIVYVPKRRMSKLSEAIQEIADVLLFRGWGVHGAANYEVD